MKRLLFHAALLVSLAVTPDAFAQMKSGEAMNHYAEVFGVTLHQRTYAYDVALIESKPASNMLVPGQQPVLTFLFTNRQDQPIDGAEKIDVLSYGTSGVGGDMWQSNVYKIADLPPIPIEVHLPPKGSQVIEVKPVLPETFGAYAFVADLGPAGRRFATSCVRAFAPAPERIQYPKLSLDDLGSDVLQGLGVQAIRLGVGYVPTTSKDYAPQMAKLGAKLKEYGEKNITVMLMFLSSSSAPQPLGRGRPHLSPEGVMLPTKQDLAWLPENDPDFRKFVAVLGKEYGWPKGPVTSMLLWNEPWEGISISGWGADSLRYREMFTAMAQGVEEARAAGAQILITGCDSSTNTFDKLFSDGKDTFLKWLDACTIHYQGLSAPVLFRKWRDRKGPNGRVKIWDTESWVANSPDRVAAVIAADRAAGYDRAMGVFGGNIVTPFERRVTLPDGTQKQVATYTLWPPAVAVSAAQHFIGERDFNRLLFQGGLPAVMDFDGLPGKAEDGTLVVVGDLGEIFGDFLQLRGVRGLAEEKEKEALRKSLDALPADSPERPALEKRLAAKGVLSGGSLVLANPAGEFVLYDFFGNPVPAQGGTISVPLDYRGFYLRANGAPGSFGRLEKAVAAARIEGIEPLNVVVHDLLGPVGSKPTLRLTLTNVLNRPVEGTLALSLGGLELAAPPRLSLAAHETRELAVPVAGGAARPDNTYPLSFRFDAGADGFSFRRENVHANVIARRTIAVDGSLDDWKGVLPQVVRASGDQGPSAMESAWLPFVKFDAVQKSGLATAYLAYDEKNFYFASKIADDTPSSGTIRFAKRDDDSYFYPETSFEYDPVKTLLKRDEPWSSALRTPGALLLPGSQTGRSFTMWTAVAGAFAVDVTVPEGAPKKVSLYFVDPDEIGNGRRQVEIDVQDAATAKSLVKQVVGEYGPGTYAGFLVAGKVRIVLRSRNWTSASLSGVFLDPAPAEAKRPAGPGAWAAFSGFDLQTAGAWAGKYGAEGFLIAGVPPEPAAAAWVSLPVVDEKIVHRWPAGVRRFSYRMRPELPFGSAPKFDNVQIAFNVIPADQKPDSVAASNGTPPGFVPPPDTDYEYALNQVDAAHGGGTEVWRCLVPGMVRKMFYPREPASPLDGAVRDARLVVRRDGNTRIVECAIPWGEIPKVREAMKAGRTVKFSFRVNDDKGPAMELAQDRSVSRKDPYAFHPDWVEHWANEVEFAFEK